MKRSPGTEPPLADTVARIFRLYPVVDIHTHLYDPAMGPLLLWGIDELLTYHYLVAEVLRARPDLAPAAFWRLAKPAQADLIWQELFVRRTPVSEACRGVLTVIQALGVEPGARDLSALRRALAGQTARGYTDRVFKLAGVSRVVMTNDPLHAAERAAWERGFERDPRFLAALRLDSAFNAWPRGASELRALGYDTDSSLSGRTLSEVRRYLADWCHRMEARYLAISLDPGLRYPDVTGSLTTLLVKAAIPAARERGIPLALMLGVRKAVNPALGDAGDSVGAADLASLERLAAAHPAVTFLVTLLARENQHALCVAARKFSNLVPFGCWWFLNNPSLIRELTAMRLEMLGLSFIPQHSDSRVLDQLVYKWTHSRAVIGEVLADKYADLAAAGRPVSEPDIRRDLAELFDGRRVLKPAG